MPRPWFRGATALAAALATACASTHAADPGAPSTAHTEVRALEDSLESQRSRIRELETALERAERTPDVAAAPPGRLSGDLLPPSAKPGECYARVFVPAEYAAEEERVLVREAAERIEVQPPRYEDVKERVLVKEASSKLVEVPAIFETVEETLVVEPARTVWRLGKRNAPIADAALVQEAAKLGLALDAARPGQCYAEHLEAERFETRSEQVVKSGASARFQVVPARFELVEERVLVSPATERRVEVPARYETVEERVLVKPAYTEWKKGRGPIERIDDATGEIMCLVEVPAEYKTVSKRVLRAPATTRVEQVPAQYKTVSVRKLVEPASEQRLEIPAEYQTVTRREKVADARRSWRLAGAAGPGETTGRQLCLAELPAVTRTVQRRVEKTPARTRRVEVPAEYATVPVRKLVAPASERRIAIPAEYETVTRRKLTRAGSVEWRSILCETNASPQLITDLQRALRQAGHDPGPIDGRVGARTLAAVRAYQREKRLPAGSLTLRTLETLGVQVRR